MNRGALKLEQFNHHEMHYGIDYQLRQNSEPELDCLGCERMDKRKKDSKRNYSKIKYIKRLSSGKQCQKGNVRRFPHINYRLAVGFSNIEISVLSSR